MSESSTGSGKRVYPVARAKVPAFARYEGTSAWRGNKRRVRAYYLHLAAEKAKASAAN